MWWSCLVLLSASVYAEVTELTGEADFHEVTLWWRSKPSDFVVKFCEVQSWGLSQCKNKFVENPMMNEVDEKKNKKIIFTTKIKSLRMATNYTFKVKKADKQKRNERKIESEIELKTKEFSARPKKCTGDTSEVEVDTGPNFSGKISVEGLKGDTASNCSIYGKADSKNTKYMLKINHTVCKSEKGDKTITTFVMVQENLTILTHSTKRFMVICNYSLPESYTVRAGVSMPGNRRHLVPIDSSIDEVDAKAPNLNLNDVLSLDSRKPSGQQYFASRVIDAGPQETQMAQMVLMIILVVAAVIGCAAAVWWFVTSHRRQHTRGFMSPQTEPRTLVYDNIENFVREQCANSNNVPVDPSVELIGVRQIQQTSAPE